MNTEIFEKFFAKRFHFTKKGVLHDNRDRATTSFIVYSKYVGWLDESERSDEVSREDVDNWIEAHQHGEGGEDADVPPREFIETWLRENSTDWSISLAWKEIKYTGFGASTSKSLDDLRTAIMADVYDKDLGYGIDAIKTTLSKMSMEGYQRGLSTVSDNLKYREKCVDAADRWLHAMYDYFKPSERYEIFECLMKHWAWQVKRKMLALPVKYHIWINFYGAAGLGKTTALAKMSKPIDDFTSTTSISKLFDDTKEIKRLTENFILIFDELALNVEGETGGGKLTADQKAILKSIITGDKMDARVYGTQDQAKRRITFSCISSANEHLYDVIFDETTMRRFFDFNCQGKRPDSFEEINKFLDNSVYFWRGIDENLDDGYFCPDSEIGREISHIQSMYYPTKTTTKMWATAVNARVGKGSINTAFREYSRWCRETGNKSKALQYFVRDLQHILPGTWTENSKMFVDFDVDVEESKPQFSISGASSDSDKLRLVGGDWGSDDDWSLSV